MINGGTTRNLTFDAFERKITDSNLTYSYDSLDRMQTRGSAAFTYDGGSNNPATDGTSKYNRTPEGFPLSTSTGTTKQWALTDQHTDLVVGLTPDGTAVNGSTAYDPFGAETATNGTTPAVGYQSGYTDPTTSDVNMAARWYQPRTGSFSSRDTWQLDPVPSVQANRYAYGNATPLNATDPTGHFPVCWTITGAIACGAIAGINAAAGYALTKWLTSSGGGSWGGLRHDYSGSLADSLRRQSRRFSGPSAGWSGLVDTGYGSGTYGPATRNVCNGTCTQPTKPPKPPIDQNPNNGNNPTPAPIRPPVAPIWISGAWSVASGAGTAATITAQAMVDLAAIALFTPTVHNGEDLYPLPDLSDEPGGGNNWRTRSDKKCDDGPGTSPTGHVTYLPRERYYDNFTGQKECRATGVFGIVDQQDLTTKKHPGPGTGTGESKRPPGYEEIRSQGHSPNNGHLQPKLAGGDGKDLRNLVAQYRRTNSPYIRDGIEGDIRKSLESGHKVAIYINPHYGRPNSGIPTRIEYNYADLNTGVAKHCVVHQLPSGGRTTGSANCPQ